MESFNKIINGDKPVLVDFFATWCGPCKMMSPILNEVKQNLGERVTILKIDVDKNQKLMAHPDYQVRGVPTLMLFQKGEILWKQSGVVSKDEIISQVSSYI